MHVNTLETDSERRKNISGNGSLFILFVKVKRDAKKKAFAKAPLFLMFCKNASIFHFAWKNESKKDGKPGNLCVLQIKYTVSQQVWEMLNVTV